METLKQKAQIIYMGVIRRRNYTPRIKDKNPDII
jgi:hypothetical protein